MCENGTMKAVEAILRSGGGRIKEKDGGDESKIYFKQFCICHNILPVQL
jgi:hypothetical protein